MSSTRQIVKDISTADITGAGKGGRLNPQQANKFRDYMVDNTAFLKDVGVEPMTSPEKQIDTLLIGNRIIRKAIEGQGPNESAGVSFPRTELKTTKIRLAADITTEFGEDNIERSAAYDHIARNLATQFGNDLADLMLNGDTATLSTDPDYAFLSIGDGIIKQANTSTRTHKYTMAASPADGDYKDTIFPKMLDLMPNQFKRDRTNMRLYCSSKVSDAYIRSIAARQTVMGDETLVNGSAAKYIGIPLFPVEYMPDSVIILTNRHNLVMGIQRQMKIYSKFAERKDLTEYTMYMRVDPGKIVWDDALVIASV